MTGLAMTNPAVINPAAASPIKRKAGAMKAPKSYAAARYLRARKAALPIDLLKATANPAPNAKPEIKPPTPKNTSAKTAREIPGPAPAINRAERTAPKPRNATANRANGLLANPQAASLPAENVR
jgi:hypothetical protein